MKKKRNENFYIKKKFKALQSHFHFESKKEFIKNWIDKRLKSKRWKKKKICINFIEIYEHTNTHKKENLK